MDDVELLHERFIEAARSGDLAATKHYLEKVTRPNVRKAALLSAALYDHLDVLAHLLENGTDKEARESTLSSLASKARRGEHTGSIALLLSHGVDDVALRDPLYWAAHHLNYDLHALLCASTDLNRQIDRYAHEQMQVDRHTLVQLTYGVASIGVSCGMSGKALLRFVDETMQQNFAYSPTPAAGKNASLDFLGETLASRVAPEALHKQIGFKPYAQAIAIRDMVSEYAQAKLLPQLLLEAGLINKFGGLGRIKQHSLDAWQKRLLPIAAALLFKDKNLQEILGMSESWHIGTNAIPPALRPLRAGQWHKLIEDTDTPFTLRQDDQDIPVTIRALSSIEELKRESDHLRHCVGASAHYSEACQIGEIHILSVQAGKVPLATLEVTLTGNARHPLQVAQFNGARNAAPPAIAKRAWEWFAAELEKPFGQRAPGVALNDKPKGGWRRMENKTCSPVLKTIGYYPTPDAIRACHDHLRDHIKIKQPVLRQRKREGAFYTPRDTEISYSWRQQLPKEALSPAVAGEAWQALLAEVKAEYPAALLARAYKFATAGAMR